MRLKNSLKFGWADQLTLLRLKGILLKLILTFIFADIFGLTPDSQILIFALMLEAVFLAFSVWWQKPIMSRPSGLFATLLIDTLFWVCWLYYSGGATNPFMFMLLLPITIAAVALPIWAPWSLALVTSLAYSAMIFSATGVTTHHHAMDMSSHYLGMWLNFVIASLVVTTSVAFIARKVRRQDAELAYMHEAQLRQETLLSLGIISAQMAHQLATPLTSLRLLADEAKEEMAAGSAVIGEMEDALSKCEKTLYDLRQATESIRDKKKLNLLSDELVGMLKQQTSLLMPEVQINWSIDDSACQRTITTDGSFLPSMLALVENAARSSSEHIASPQVDISMTLSQGSAKLLFSVRDYGSGIPERLIHQLGHKIVDNPKGLGVALMLSHASFERLGGQLMLTNHADGGANAEVSLPLTEAN